MHSKFQTGGALTALAMHCAVQGLTGALPDNATLAPSGAAIATVTTGDGRTAWRFPTAGTSQLTSGAQNIPNFYGGAVMVRFIWQGYDTGQSDGRILQIGNLLYLSITTGKVAVTAINGQNITRIGLGPTLTVGTEYCVVFNVDYSASTATTYINGTNVDTTALSGWTANTTMSTTVTVGDATGRTSFDLIEFGWYNGSQTASALTDPQIAAISGGSYFLDTLRPTHPATAPMTYTASIIGGRATDVHTVGLRRTSDPVNDAGTIVASGSRTGPGAISIADPATDTGGRRFYRLEVSSTGSIRSTTTNYSSGAPGGFVLGCVPVLVSPNSSAFSLISGCPAMGILGDSRTPTQAQLNVAYQIMKSGSPSITVVGAPGSTWLNWDTGAASYSGVLNGSAFTANLMTTYLNAATAAGVTVTGVLLDVNSWGAAGTDTTYRAQVQTTITQLRNAGHKVVLIRDIGNEFSAQSQSNFIAHEAFITGLADGVNMVYSDDAFQQWYASHLDLVSIDGTHLIGSGALNTGGSNVDGLTAGQITANYIMSAVQTAILPGVTLFINNATISLDPSTSGTRTTTRTITVRPVNGFTGSCSLSVSGLPTGVTATLSPASPLNITSSSAVTVTMTITAASDAPLTSSPASVTVTASAATSAPTLALTVAVVDVTAPTITEVVIDLNGTSVTVTLDSLATGNTGVSIFEAGSLRAFTGNLATTDNIHFTGTLATACSPGTSCTWSYNPSTGNLVDAGGNEIPSSSGSATNNTSGGSGGGGGGGSALLVLGPFVLTYDGSCACNQINLNRGDTVPLRLHLRGRGGGQIISVAGATLTASLEQAGTPLVSGLAIVVITEDEGYINLTVNTSHSNLTTTTLCDLVVSRSVGGQVLIFKAPVRIS